MSKLKASEIRRIIYKKKQWDIAIASFYASIVNFYKSKFWKSFRKEVRIFMDKAFNWYFFYKPVDKGDKAWHVIEWTVVTTIILRLLGLI